MDKECCGNPLRGCEDCPPRKLTFEEWFDIQVKTTGFSDPWQNSYESAKDAWKAAQENKE